MRVSIVDHRMLLAVVAVIANSAGCASGPTSMESAASVPASEGTVEATEGDNGNTNIDIRVKNLALPGRVAAGATTYVVWLRAHDASSPTNIGGLEVDDELVGRFSTSTPFKRFSVMITPEASGQAERPTHDAVFSSRVSRED